MSKATKSGPRLVPGGIEQNGETRALYAGSVHYWRHPRPSWRASLQAVKSMGFRLIDVYVPWAVHELGPGRFDFGEQDARLDVVAFLELVAELGLWAIVRPGPHINAELTCFGIPERVIWSPECQARSPRGNPVILPMIPVAFPVPSYASEAFFREAAVFFAALGPRLAPLLGPRGPIVLLQVDNEGALYFRDGAYDQDYHPDAVSLYRQFLAERYETHAQLERVYGPSPAFDTIEPPRRFDATKFEDLPRHIDWVEFHEHLLEGAMRRVKRDLAEVGLTGVPTSHNLPFGQETMPLNPARIGRVVDLVALDYYHRASPVDRQVIARRTSELAVRSEAYKVPAYAAEMGAGFPPFFPPLDEADSAFTLLCALAYGLRGFNIYMAVARDRWVGAPVDPQGKRRPFAIFYERLIAALDRVDFPSLRRATPVRLVTPRSLRRLSRAMHAFGPATGAFFAVIGQGPRERCFEWGLGLDGPIALEGDDFTRAFEQALEARGVPFAHVGGEDADVALDEARWVVCATTGGLKPALVARLRDLARRGARVTLGPREPTRDGSMRPLASPLDLTGLDLFTGEASLGPAAIDRLVARAIDDLDLPTYACDSPAIFACMHDDAAGNHRLLFVLNPTTEDRVTRVSATGFSRVRDLLDGGQFEAERGAIELRLAPRSVRLLSVEG